MKIQIREQNGEVSDTLRAHVQRRLALALGRFGARIGRVVVHFSAQDSADRSCQIEVGLNERSVQAEVTDPDPFAALSHAADRVARSVARAIELQAAWDTQYDDEYSEGPAA